MEKILVIQQPKQVVIEEQKSKELRPNELRIQTLYSGISAGTQLTLYRGTAPFASKKWDPQKRLFETTNDDAGLYPVRGAWGYEEVGKVVEVGADVSTVQLGNVIYGAWGHRSHHIVDEAFAVDHKLLEGLDPICGIFAQIGAIGLNAVLDANIHVGETVLIFGQGVPGQIVSQLAKLNGATVIAVDLDDYRLEYSTRFGADQVLNAGSCDVAQTVRELTNGRGADVAIEISGALPALHEAIRSVAYNGRVVGSGFYQGEGNGLYLGDEFHHNRIQLISSQIEQVSPELMHRWNRLRLEQTIMKLQQNQKLHLSELITHTFNFEQAAQAYDMLDQQQQDSLQVVLQF